MNKQVVLYTDDAEYKSPTIITLTSQWLGIVLVDINKLYVIELTIGFETQITINAERKKYEQLSRQWSYYYDEVKNFNISVRVLELIGKYCQELCNLIEYLTNKQTRNYIMNEISVSCIPSSYYLFFCRDKPKLLSWWNLF